MYILSLYTLLYSLNLYIWSEGKFDVYSYDGQRKKLKQTRKEEEKVLNLRVVFRSSDYHKDFNDDQIYLQILYTAFVKILVNKQDCS